LVTFARGDTLQRGTALTLWNDNLTGLGDSLDKFKADGGTHVCVNVWWFQDNINSTVIAPDYSRYSAHDDTVRAALDAVQARGLTPVLKPLVDLRNDSSHWRGQIVGGEPWFSGTQGYGAFINHFADIAQNKSVPLLIVGTELGGTAAQETNWRTTIAGVKSRYAGQLSYAANWGNPAVGESIAWWDALDYIGIDAYYPLTAQDNPPLGQLISAWSGRAAQIEAWRSSLPTNQQKPVLFTEVGYCSQSGSNKAPYSDANSGVVNQAEQANCYEALLSQLWGVKPWFQGAYWWNWEVAAHPGDTLRYTPQDKLAEEMMKSYYAAAGTTPTASWNGTANTSWNNVTNWSPGNVPNINRDVAVLGIKGSLLNPTLDSDTTVRQLKLTGAGWTIGGSGTLRIESPAAGSFLIDFDSPGLGANTVNCPIAVSSSSYSRFMVATGNTLTVNAAVSASGSAPVYLESWWYLGGAGTLKLAAPSGDNAPMWVVRKGNLVLAHDDAAAGSRPLVLGANSSQAPAILAEGPRTIAKDIDVGMTIPWAEIPWSGFNGTIGGCSDEDVTFSGKITMNTLGVSGEYTGINLTSTTTNSRAVTFSGVIAGPKSITKTGSGRVVLSNTGNSYTGATLATAGTLRVTGSIASTSGVIVASGAKLELAGTGSSALAAATPVLNDGLLEVFATGPQEAGVVTGAGTTQVEDGASFTADSIVQNALVIGAGGSVTVRETSVAVGSIAGGNAVPEPSAGVLIGIALLGWLAFRHRLG
jgi:autotransporter-associated beta strand protein